MDELQYLIGTVETKLDLISYRFPDQMEIKYWGRN